MKCDCGDDICRAHNGYVFVDSGLSVCAAGCVVGSIAMPDLNPRDSHIVIVDARAATSCVSYTRAFSTVPNHHHAAAVAIAKTNDASSSLPNAASAHREVVSCGRTHPDRRLIFELCRCINLSGRVMTEAYLVLDFINKLNSRDFKRRAQKRQALLIAIVCIACERNHTDHHGERLRQMCVLVLNTADAKTFTAFGRQIRAMRILVSHALGAMAFVSDDFTMRISSHAWGRLGRSGLVEQEVANVTRALSLVHDEWTDSLTKLGDAIVPAIVYLMFGEEDVRTASACDEYNYRLNTIIRHAALIEVNAPASVRAVVATTGATA